MEKRTLWIFSFACIALIAFTTLGTAIWNCCCSPELEDPLPNINILRPVRQVSEKFLSIALDTGLLRNGHLPDKLRSSRLLQRVRELRPAYLRVGGTAADCLLFEEGTPKLQNTSSEYLDGGACSYEGLDCEKPAKFTMSGQDWVKINQFAEKSRLKLIFDLNVLLRDETRWNSTNAKELLKFSDRLGFDVVWQLGNEPNSFQHVFQTTVSGEQLGEDFLVLRNLLDSFTRYSGSQLVGPDVTRPKSLEQGSVEYLGDFLSIAGNQTVSAVTWHQYYVNGRTATEADFVDPMTLNVLQQQVKAVMDVVQEFSPGTPVWLSETSSAYGGGAPGLSDRFVAGFMWLDKLATAARMGIDVVIRQSLLGGHYALLDDHSFEPRPDWWLSVLFKKFVGRVVLSVGSELPKGSVRLYCHCTHSKNGSIVPITLYGMNLKNETVHVDFPNVPTFYFYLPSAYTAAYILTAPDGLLTSKSVLLNGVELQLGPGGALPKFIPVRSGLFAPLVFPPYSMGFWVLHGLHTPACLL